MAIAINFYQTLFNSVKIIWYEPEDNISGVDLFTRLNIGRIPLTNSELVRALFLSRNSDLTPAEQLEIAAEWDSIEKELHQLFFWAFLTNYQPEDYPNRIDLLFDLMAGGKSRDKYATFFYFNNKIKEKEKKQDVWKEIIAYFAPKLADTFCGPRPGTEVHPPVFRQACAREQRVCMRCWRSETWGHASV